MTPRSSRQPWNTGSKVTISARRRARWAASILVDAAAPGATLVLEDGDYTGKSGCVLNISKSITIRAKNTGRAVLDGEGKWRVVDLSGGDVALQGLNITGGNLTGYTDNVLLFVGALDVVTVASGRHCTDTPNKSKEP